MKRLKKLFSLVLAFSLIAGLVPTSLLAESITNEDNQSNSKEITMVSKVEGAKYQVRDIEGDILADVEEVEKDYTFEAEIGTVIEVVPTFNEGYDVATYSILSDAGDVLDSEENSEAYEIEITDDIDKVEVYASSEDEEIVEVADEEIEEQPEDEKLEEGEYPLNDGTAKVMYHYYNESGVSSYSDYQDITSHSFTAPINKGETATIKANNHVGAIGVNAGGLQYRVMLDYASATPLGVEPKDIAEETSYDANTGIVSIPKEYEDRNITVIFYIPSNEVTYINQNVNITKIEKGVKSTKTLSKNVISNGLDLIVSLSDTTTSFKEVSVSQNGYALSSQNYLQAKGKVTIMATPLGGDIDVYVSDGSSASDTKTTDDSIKFFTENKGGLATRSIASPVVGERWNITGGGIAGIASYLYNSHWSWNVYDHYPNYGFAVTISGCDNPNLTFNANDIGLWGRGGSVSDSSGSSYNVDYNKDHRWVWADCKGDVDNNARGNNVFTGGFVEVQSINSAAGTITCYFEMTSVSDYDGHAMQTIWGTFVAPYEMTGSLQIKKELEGPFAGYPNYGKRSDAKFALYTKDVSGVAANTLIHIFSIDENTGLSDVKNDLVAGTYYLRETTTIKGTESPDLGGVDSSGSTNYREVTITAGQDHRWLVENPFVNTMLNDPFDFRLRKEDPIGLNGYNNISKYPQGGAELAGAQYTVKLYKDSTKSSVLKTWIFETGKFSTDLGLIRIGTQSYVGGDSLYLDEAGSAIYPIGYYEVQETKAPIGYLINTAVYKGSVIQTSNGNVKWEWDVSSTGTGKNLVQYNEATKEATVWEESIILGGLQVEKEDESTGATPQGNADLSGIKFSIKNLNDNAVVVKDKEYAKNKEVMQITTAKVGSKYIASTGATDLPYGKYSVTEIATNNTYQLTDGTPREFFVDTQGKIETEDIDGKPLVFKNDPYYAGYHVEKWDYHLNKNETIAPVKLNSTYKLYNRSDNPVEVNGKIYAVNSVIETVVLPDNGQYTSDKYMLPVGKYEIIETSPATGMTMKGITSKTFTVRGEQDHGKIFGKEETGDYGVEVTNLKNKRIMGDIQILKLEGKLDGDDTEQRKPMVGCTFTVTHESGEVVTLEYKGDGIYSTEGMDSDQDLYADGRLQFGKWLLEETVTPAGFKPIEPIEFDIEKNGVVKKGIYIDDIAIQTPLKIVKVDSETGKTIPLTDTTFRILDENKEVITLHSHYPTEVALTEFKTNELGEVQLPERLPYGKYYIEELESPYGYLKGELLEFKVVTHSDWTNPLVVEYADDNAKGIIKVKKVDVETKEPLGGAIFEIYADEDITTPDGTIRLEKDKLACTITSSDIDGIATSPELYLGKYRVIEKESPFAYGLNTDVFKVELKYKDQLTPIVYGDVTVENMHTKIETEALDVETNSQEALPLENLVVRDKVKYTDAVPGKEYSVKGVLMDKDTQEALKDENGEDIVSEEVLFTPKEKDGFVYVYFTFNAVPHRGKTTVVFETLYQDKKEVWVHADFDDEDQTIEIKDPKVRTLAKDNLTNQNIAFTLEETVLTDTVEYEDVIPNLPYEVTGILMDKATGEPRLDEEGNTITGIAKFTPTESSGTVDVEFKLNTIDMDGVELVVFEKLLYKSEEIANHEDLDDEGQTITFTQPEVGTTAYNTVVEGELGKISYATDKMIFDDVVKYSKVIAGLEYKVTGVLMDKATNEPILDANGKEIHSEATFTAEDTEGEVTVTFEFDGSNLVGKDIVVFEDLLYKDVTIATHHDIEDEGQTIEVLEPEIGTKVANIVVDNDDKTNAYATDKMVFEDTVSYTDLIIGETHTVKGILMDKETEKPVLDVNGNEVTAETEFTVERPEDLGEDALIASGEVVVVFEFDGSNLAGKDVVVFEDLEYKGYVIAKHHDIEDEDQTIKVVEPEIETKVANIVTDGYMNEAHAQKDMVFEDIVTYKDLIVGETHTVKGVLMDKETNEPILDDVGNEITAETTFVVEEGQEAEYSTDADKVIEDSKNSDKEDVDENITEESEGSEDVVSDEDVEDVEVPKDTLKVVSGSVKVTFIFDGTKLIGKDVVVFEDLFYKDFIIASHHDINDENQTIEVVEPKLHTTAKEKGTGNKVVTITDKEITIEDTIKYEDMIVGETVKFVGILMDKATQKPLLINGKTVESEIDVEIKEKNGEAIVEFSFPTKDFGDSIDLVVFEKALDVKGNIIASHEDIDDEGQTVKLIRKPVVQKTGTLPLVVGGLVVLLLGILITLVSYFRRKRSA